MPYAKGRGLHADRPLSNLAVKYANDLKGFIATKVVPEITVKHETDNYYIFGRDNFRIPETLRANGAKANQAEYTLSTSSYTLEAHALRDIITDRDKENADDILKPTIDAQENLVERIMLRKEIQARDLLFTTTSFSNNHSLTSTLKWTVLSTTSDPIGDVNTGTSVILQNSGKRPNVLAMGYVAFNNGLSEHPNVLERIKFSERGIITKDLLASLFGLPTEGIQVGEAIQNTGDEGGADSMAFIWSTDAWLGYVSNANNMRTPSAAYNFVKSGKTSFPFSVTRYRDEPRQGEWVEVESFFDSKAVGTSAAYLIRGVD